MAGSTAQAGAVLLPDAGIAWLHWCLHLEGAFVCTQAAASSNMRFSSDDSRSSLLKQGPFWCCAGLTFCGCTCAGGEEQDPAREAGQLGSAERKTLGHSPCGNARETSPLTMTLKQLELRCASNTVHFVLNEEHSKDALLNSYEVWQLLGRAPLLYLLRNRWMLL